MSDDILVKDGRMYGGWRRPINTASGARGSIHDDETARRVGMRGGTIAGTIHLNLFAPLFVKLWGQRWFERGSLSMFYAYATLDREEVRAFVTLPPEGATDVQVEAGVETPEGRTVAQGTVSVGDAKGVSYLQGQELVNAEPEELRILTGLKAGDELPSRDVVVAQETIDRGLQTITEPLDWYRGSSPWGPSIVNPSAMYGAMMLTPVRPDGKPFSAVGFFGATEVRNVNGPIKVGVPYRAKGKLACVGTSSRTEYYWYDSYLEERDSGKRVAEMRKMLRYMKAGSPYYQDVKV